ncbi:ATP-binding protein [Streptomyces sp. HB2AG]|uniref:ATP-binding protein n=1 Tax=Streptomyces sp. HB2AG TaxID=2983400 RepID=UPI0022AAB253|nr:ATP-binding protein [Streptomyces sp. HB2AG]MCZ2523135.1 ATP-binding protein [Streptomyces sp. HB2AG]
MTYETTLPASVLFCLPFAPAPHGARLARVAAGGQLAAWGLPPGHEAHDAAALVVSELATNAVRHGSRDGQSLELRLLLLPDPAVLRVEVSDARGGTVPDPVPPGPVPVHTTDSAEDGAESGRGLLLVDALATRWGWAPGPGTGKTVWAELDLPVNA